MRASLGPPCAIILGLPGSGKTRLAVGLALALQRAGEAAFVLHTDILKVTLRALECGPVGPTYTGNIHEKLRVTRPFLEAQCAKAESEGYRLVIEGTLALGFAPPRARIFVLEVDESTRLQRVKAKHQSAQEALAHADLADYTAALKAVPGYTRLNANGSAEDLVSELMRELGHQMGASCAA